MKRRRDSAAFAALLLAAAMAAGCDSGSAPSVKAPATAADKSAPPAKDVTAQAPASPSPARVAESEAARPVAIAEGTLAVSYPQEGTLFPPESIAPTFVWTDTAKGPERWNITIRLEGSEPLTFQSDKPKWKPSEETWKQVKAASVAKDAEFTIARDGGDAGKPLSTETRRIRTSTDPVGDSIFYREVPLPFLTAVQDPSRIRWRFGTIDTVESPPIVLQNLPVCGNCHSFADNGSVLGLDVDYGNDKGAYAVIPTAKEMVMSDDKIITWADYKKEDGELTFGLLSRVSPTGRYVVSTVKDRSVFVATPEIAFSQLFFPIKGILVVYDRETKKFTELPGADDPEYVQSNAVWSPDGKEIMFARSKAYRAEKLDQKNAALIDEKDVPEFTRDKKPFRYDLYRVPFNDGKGGKAVPVVGASGDGRSNFFPKYSPDGKWVVFCKANSYMLLQPDSELYIVPTAGGEARRLKYNTKLMNSWHSWSSNSRWLVFSSKVNTPYTQLFLTHIDENGNDSPPVLLEQFTSPDRAANIPEFVKLPGDAIAGIKEQFLDAYSFLRAGMANEHTGDHAGAERHYRRGLEVNPDNPELHNALGWTLFQVGRTPEAVAEYEKAIKFDPKHVKSRNNIALALVELGKLDEAVANLEVSLELEPKAEIWSDYGFIHYRMGEPQEALAAYKKALALDPKCPSAHFNLAVAAVMERRFADADTAETWNGLGYVLAKQDRLDDAVAAYRKAVELEPKFAPAYNNLGEALVRQGKLADAELAYRKSLAEKRSASIHNQLGEVLAKLGRNDDAAAEFRAALAIDKGNGQARRGLAEVTRSQETTGGRTQ
jgi:Flp pilus assembly protein TadD